MILDAKRKAEPSIFDLVQGTRFSMEKQKNASPVFHGEASAFNLRKNQTVNGDDHHSPWMHQWRL